MTTRTLVKFKNGSFFRKKVQRYLEHNPANSAIHLTLVNLSFRESSTELRELESKLRQAYINKELHLQLNERRKKEKLREEQV